MLKKYLSYIPFVLLIGFLLLMQFTSYEKVDQLPILKGDGIEWTSDDLEESLIKAQEQDKLIFVDFYAKWCRPCKMLKSVTFPRESVGELFNKNFINLSIDVESPQGNIIAKRYSITSYPTLLILNSAGQEVSRKVGFVIPLQLNNWAEESLAHKK
ncbi:Thioredoxin-like [Spirosomataceae bacterium TFI 002]|nr:Thioredoxin-like [Spirosomataceae bacterium TFI 002]